MKKDKPAYEGGAPVRTKKMPPRSAFGDQAMKLVMEAYKFYEDQGEDPPYQGKYEEAFCSAFTNFMGGGYADAVATGTGAIYVALAALELPPGSEVLISPVTDSGPLNCIILQNLIPVVIDSAPGSYNAIVDQVLERITNKTTAFLAVHSAGEPLQIDKIVAECHKRNIKVLEDCSQAPGAQCNGERVGVFGDIAAFSTMYRKSLVAGSSGGLVYTRNKALYEKALGHADRGKPVWRTDLNLKDPTNAAFPALNWNTDEFSCAIGLASLERLQKTIDSRIQFVEIFIELLESQSQVCTPYRFSNKFSPFFYPVFVNEDKLKITKTEFANALAVEGIPVNAHYGCLVRGWKWAEKHLSDDFVTENAFHTQRNSFNIFLNENYGREEAENAVEAIVKLERYYKR